MAERIVLGQRGDPSLPQVTIKCVAQEDAIPVGDRDGLPTLWCIGDRLKLGIQFPSGQSPLVDVGLQAVETEQIGRKALSLMASCPPEYLDYAYFQNALRVYYMAFTPEFNPEVHLRQAGISSECAEIFLRDRERILADERL